MDNNFEESYGNYPQETPKKKGTKSQIVIKTFNFRDEVLDIDVTGMIL